MKVAVAVLDLDWWKQMLLGKPVKSKQLQVAVHECELQNQIGYK